MATTLIYVSLVFSTLLVAIVLCLLLKRQIRLNKLRKHLAPNYVIECKDINTANETRLLLVQVNKDGLQEYYRQQQNQSISYTTSL